jgi:ADP-heptose:LPS heptosyltransferase
MGFGDYIMLTALAENAGKNNKKISFYYLTSRKKKVQKKNYAKLEVLYNNPDVAEILIESRLRFFLRKLCRFLKGEKGYVYFPLRRFTQAYMVPLPDKKYHFKLKNTELHAVEAFCKAAGLKAHSVKPKVFLTDKEKNKVDAILAENRIAPGSYIIIETSALLENSTKLWPFEHWRKLLEMIQERYPGLKILQVSPGQKDFDGVVDISGKTSFRESLRFVEQATAVITTEGALMHSAAAYDTPCLVIISGCMSPKVTAYPGQTRVFYDKELSCSECGFFAGCPRDNFCMNEISPERVFEAFCKMIGKLSKELKI